MFTGIIEEVGRVLSLSRNGESRRIAISCSKILPELNVGDSIAVSGACLTAARIRKDSFTADLAQETWARTSFSRLKKGALVNLELPMRAQGRFHGHIVQGHVDGTGSLVRCKPIPGANDYWLTLEVPSELTRYIVEKGSLAVEGISLTVASIEGTRVRVAIIPHTAEATNLHSLKPGARLNLEVDVIAKYVEKLVSGSSPQSSITLARLVSAGF
jgi:riboflavin synthase